MGQKIIEIARSREQPGFDASVEKDTGAKSFECLVLQVAMVESSALPNLPNVAVFSLPPS